MKSLLTTVAILPAAPALAHPGHMAEALGHDHWLGAAAIGLAIALGLWAKLKGKDQTKTKDNEEAEDEAEAEELQEA
ncbi:DUF6732 family protein [Pseudohalocynthiibacter aestuariivivens]|jgi:Family of unknown function (DUF6732)|uniref:DUF6732 family protein n=1 Tax=Pseudohalocynthiibacter aestuariivivens TaxID=1591409 RepID=A0ABV5JJ97_9RHOB|nr:MULTISPECIES: DUF6732 family protein [Pseudohalocynthiibacter]MBS9715445.1 hypothetical protein [Pseudohalocynthiibacter aestuariivivens]MCK0102609.1 hypothetical protein [Pseudohalocynthiibacter sp. F2068]